MKAPDFAGSPWVTFASWREDSNDGQPFTMTVLEEGQPGPQAKYVKIGNPPQVGGLTILPYKSYPQQKHNQKYGLTFALQQVPSTEAQDTSQEFCDFDLRRRQMKVPFFGGVLSDSDIRLGRHSFSNRSGGWRVGNPKGSSTF